jgi:hypothetical protein
MGSTAAFHRVHCYFLLSTVQGFRREEVAPLLRRLELHDVLATLPDLQVEMCCHSVQHQLLPSSLQPDARQCASFLAGPTQTPCYVVSVLPGYLLPQPNWYQARCLSRHVYILGVMSRIAQAALGGEAIEPLPAQQLAACGDLREGLPPLPQQLTDDPTNGNDNPTSGPDTPSSVAGSLTSGHKGANIQNPAGSSRAAATNTQDFQQQQQQLRGVPAHVIAEHKSVCVKPIITATPIPPYANAAMPPQQLAVTAAVDAPLQVPPTIAHPSGAPLAGTEHQVLGNVVTDGGTGCLVHVMH